MDSLLLLTLLIAPDEDLRSAKASAPGASLTVEFSQPLPAKTANDIVGWITPGVKKEPIGLEPLNHCCGQLEKNLIGLKRVV